MDYKSFFRDIYKNFDLSAYDVNSEIDFVIFALTGMQQKDFILGRNLSNLQQEKIIEILKKRVETGRPIQQIVGKSFFAGDEFFVDENTLIPRPETEFLVQKACECFGKEDKIKILDIGTGSGCIAIELAKYFYNSEITAVDICQATLDMALKNAENHRVSDRIKLVKSDVFDSVCEKFDMIVSNPPYIPFKDKSSVQKDVFDFEPHSALFAEDDGLYFYKKIIKNANNFLKLNGYLIFEVGINQARLVADILKTNGFKNPEIIKDFDNIERVVAAKYSV